MSEATKDIGKDVGKAAAEIGKDVGEGVKGMAKEAKDMGKEIAQDANKDFDTLRADFDALKKEMSEFVSMFKTEAKNKVHDIKDDLTESGGRLSEQLRRLLEKSGDATSTAAQTATHTLEDRVTAHPLMSVIGAFGIGLLVARLLEKR